MFFSRALDLFDLSFFSLRFSVSPLPRFLWVAKFISWVGTHETTFLVDKNVSFGTKNPENRGPKLAKFGQKLAKFGQESRFSRKPRFLYFQNWQIWVFLSSGHVPQESGPQKTGFLGPRPPKLAKLTKIELFDQKSELWDFMFFNTRVEFYTKIISVLRYNFVITILRKNRGGEL